MKQYQLFQTKKEADEYRKELKKRGFRGILWEFEKEKRYVNSGCVGILAANDSKYKYSVEWIV